MRARIYKQSKPAGQSGLVGTREWILEYGQNAPRVQDTLMGWTGSCGDTLSQIRLVFKSLEAAKAYAEREGIAYQVEQPTVKIKRPKAYSDNFRADRIQNWTH
ncbi:MAG: ETC complex I subunit [Acetobacter sp.]|nr:ETC complex I subunit [Acetobacter sp.]